MNPQQSAALLALAEHHDQQSKGTPDQWGNKPVKPNLRLEEWHRQQATLLRAIASPAPTDGGVLREALVQIAAETSGVTAKEVADRFQQIARQALAATPAAGGENGTITFDELMQRESPEFQARVNARYEEMRDEIEQSRVQDSGAEPIGWVFQHGETGRKSFCPNDGVNTPDVFVKLNPRYTLCSAAYDRVPHSPCTQESGGEAEKQACIWDAAWDVVNGQDYAKDEQQMYLLIENLRTAIARIDDPRANPTPQPDSQAGQGEADNRLVSYRRARAILDDAYNAGARGLGYTGLVIDLQDAIITPPPARSSDEAIGWQVRVWHERSYPDWSEWQNAGRKEYDDVLATGKYWEYDTVEVRELFAGQARNRGTAEGGA